MKIANKITLSFYVTGLILVIIIVMLTRAGLHVIPLFILVPIIAGLMGQFISKFFSRPIRRLNEGTEIILLGNLEYKVGKNSKDEIGELSRSFDELTKHLKKANESIYALNRESADHEETDRELREREEYFRRLFEYSNDAVFIYDFDGKIIDVNKKACDMLGYSKDKLLQIQFFNLQIEEELTKSKKAFKTHTKTGSVRFESKFQTKDGSAINVEISSSIVDLKKGIMQSIVSNITERKKMEKSLRESEEKFRTFMETANDLMYITDEDGNFIYVNESMVNALGYSREEIIGMPFHEILDKESLEDSRIRRQQFIDSGEDIHQLVWETKTRKKIDGEMKAVAIYDNEGKFRGIRGVFRDITDRRKIEESQRLAQLGKFAADMAHEVNNQMMIISSRATISLMRAPKDKDLEKDLNIINKQCDQVKDIVKRLLLFSKPSRGDFNEVNIHETIEFVVDLVERQFLKNKVKIIKKFSSSLPTVKVDEKQMQEVYMNLLRNAFEAMTDGGKITISTSRKNGNIQIDFSDTGSGITETDMKNIFDPFFTTKDHGTGLGLSVCYGIIKAHNGDLKYTSKVNKGTTASVMLPVSS